MGEKFTNFVKMLNIGDCTIQDMEYILKQYKKMAKTNCHENLEGLVNRMFNFSYTADKLSAKTPQKNYCLIGVASITAKLTRDSEMYTGRTANEIAKLLVKIYDYISVINRVDENKYILSSEVYCISALDKMITTGQYNDVRSVEGLSMVASLLFSSNINSLTLKGDYGEKAKENIDKIAKQPDIFLPADLFGIPVNRHDLVDSVVQENFDMENDKYFENKIGRK